MSLSLSANELPRCKGRGSKINYYKGVNLLLTSSRESSTHGELVSTHGELVSPHGGLKILRPCWPLFFFLFVLFVSLPVTAMAADVTRPAATRMTEAEYQYQNALYEYMTGESLGTSIRIVDALESENLTPAARQKLLALLRMSSLRRLYPTGFDPSVRLKLIPKKGLPVKLWLRLLEDLYQNDEFVTLAMFSKGLRISAVAGYSRGLGLEEQNKLEKATASFNMVKKGARLYPYSRLNMAQIDVREDDLVLAEQKLRGLLLYMPKSAPVPGAGIKEPRPEAITSKAFAAIKQTKTYAMIKESEYVKRGVEFKKKLTQQVRQLVNEVMPDKAERMLGRELKERVHLLLGQVLFEQERYDEALLEFMKIPEQSVFYRRALLGKAWSLMKLESYENALPVITEIESTDYYESLNWEKELMYGYSLIKLKKAGNAKFQFRTLLAKIKNAQGEVQELINNRKARKLYIDRLIAPDVKLGAKEDEYYFALVKDDPELREMVREYESLETLKAVLSGKNQEVAELRAYVNNSASSLDDMFQYFIRDSGFTEQILKNLNRQSEYGRKRKISKENLDFFGGAEEQLYQLWKINLKRGLNKDERKLIRLILYEGGESLECYDSLLMCTVMSMVSPEAMDDKSQSELGYVTRVLSSISLDLTRVKQGKMIRFKQRAMALQKLFNERISEARTKLKELDGRTIALNAKIIHAEGELSRSMDKRMQEMLEEVKVELSDYRFHAMAGLVSLRGARIR